MKRPTPSELIRDLVIVAGVVAIVIGLFQAWRPLGWIAAGALLVAGAILSQLESDRKQRQQERERHEHGL